MTTQAQSKSATVSRGAPLAPNARYRIYSRLRSYVKPLMKVLTGGVHKGDGVERLEREIAERFGAKHAIATSQARVGIYLTMKRILKPGQRVVMSPYTIADVVNMIIAAGGEPAFCDLEPHTCNIDPDKIEAMIDDNTGAVLITHLHGLAADPQKCKEICERHNVPLIEDSAQAFGGLVDGQRTGTFGHAGVFSLGMYKNINAWYGGAVITDDEELANGLCEDMSDFDYEPTGKILKRMRKGFVTDVLTSAPAFKSFVFWIFRYGMLKDVEAINKRVRTELDVKRYDGIKPAYLKRLTPMQAEIALEQLDQIDADTKVRIEKARMYYEGLRDLPGLILPPPLFDGSHIYTYYPVRVPDRDRMLKWMMKHRCDVAAQHLKNCADLPGFDAFGYDCPVARDTAVQIVLLPTYPRYPDKDVRRNIDVLRAFPDWAEVAPTNAATPVPSA